MTSLIDSQAAFKARAKELNVQADVMQGLEGNGFGALSTLAFCCQSSPGQNITDDQLQDFLNNLGLTRVPLAQLAILKRLIFEAHTLIIHSLKDKVEATDQAPVRKLNAAEQDDRITKQAARLAGVRMKGELEVAHCVIDAVNHQLEQRQLKYLAPHKRIKRETELTGSKPQQRIFLDNGSLAVKDQELHLTCDASTELQAFHALQMRALAYDACNRLTYDVSMEWIHYLFEHLHRDSAPGYKPDLTAILRADRQAWIVMAEQCHDFGLQADGSLPLDQLLSSLKTHPDVAFNLLPRPNMRTVSGASVDTKEKEKDSPSPSGHKGKGKSKGKSKGKGKTRRTPMPSALQGQWSATSTRQPICLITTSATDAPKPQQVESAPKGFMCAVNPNVGRSTLPRIIPAQSDYLHPPLQGRPFRNFSQLSFLQAAQGSLPVFAHSVCARVLELIITFPKPFAAQF